MYENREELIIRRLACRKAEKEKYINNRVELYFDHFFLQQTKSGAIKSLSSLKGSIASPDSLLKINQSHATVVFTLTIITQYPGNTTARTSGGDQYNYIPYSCVSFSVEKASSFLLFMTLTKMASTFTILVMRNNSEGVQGSWMQPKSVWTEVWQITRCWICGLQTAGPHGILILRDFWLYVWKVFLVEL